MMSFDLLNAVTGGRATVAIALAAVLAVLLAGRVLRWLEPRLAQSNMGPRIAKYLATALRTTVLTAAVTAIVWGLALANGRRDLGEALADIGLRSGFAPDEGAVLTVAMVAASAIVSASIGWVRRAAGGAPTQAALDFLPVTWAETSVFTLVLAPIGSTGEEIIFRGFLMGQFWGLMGNGWIAAAISSVVFGLMHAYQGRWGMLRTGLIGMVFAAGVVLTGSLVPSIMAHVLANIAGALVRGERAMRTGAQASER